MGETAHCVVDIGTVTRRTHDVVRQAGEQVARIAQSVEGGDHLGAYRSVEAGEDIGPGDAMAESLRLLGEEPIELVGADLATLDPRPGVRVGLDGVHRSDEVAGDPVALLISVEGLEGTRCDHPTEVPEDGAMLTSRCRTHVIGLYDAFGRSRAEPVALLRRTTDGRDRPEAECPPNHPTRPERV